MMMIFLLGDMLDKAVLTHFVFACAGGWRSLDQSSRSQKSQRSSSFEVDGTLRRRLFTRDSHMGVFGNGGRV